MYILGSEGRVSKRQGQISVLIPDRMTSAVSFLRNEPQHAAAVSGLSKLIFQGYFCTCVIWYDWLYLVKNL